MKDAWLDQPNIRRNGVLDTKRYTDEIHGWQESTNDKLRL
jgi:hypothetical protein